MAKPSDDAANWLWLKNWAKTVDVKLVLILADLNKLGDVTPELAASFARLQCAVKVLDDKIKTEGKT